MVKSAASVAQQIVRAAVAFAYQRTRHAPGSAGVLKTDEGLAVTLNNATAVVGGGSARRGLEVRDLPGMYRDLFAEPSNWLRREISQITGMQVRAVRVEVDAATHVVVVFMELSPSESTK